MSINHDMPFDLPPSIRVIKSANLYKWAKVWGGVQKRYYPEPVELRRERQIRDFLTLNGFRSPLFVKDTDVFDAVPQVHDPDQADVVVITDQKFSRYPCAEIINRVRHWLDLCPHLVLCLNKHYVNIDHAFLDESLSDNLNQAISQWLKNNLTPNTVIDLSLDVIDRGDWFTWVIPDRIFYITHASS